MTTNIHDYSQAEAIVLSIDSVSAVTAGLPVIDPTPAPNTVPMSFDTGNIDPAWFDTPGFNLNEIAGASGGVAMPPIPKSTVKLQAPSGSDIIPLDLLVDREDILVVATQDSVCFDVKPLTKPASEALLRSRQIRLALVPGVTLHSLTSLNNSMRVPAHLSTKLPTTSGGSLPAGSLWLITLDWVEGRFKSQAAGWHMTEVYGPFEINADLAGPADLMLLDGATAVFPINSGNPDGTETLPDATYFPSGVRYYVGDISTNASRAYIVPFLWGLQDYTIEDKSQGRFSQLLAGPNVVLSEGNSRASAATGGTGVANKSARTRGKWYLEIHYQDSASMQIGVAAGLYCAKSFNVPPYGFQTAQVMVGYYDGSTYYVDNLQPTQRGIAAPTSRAVGDTVGIAYDIDNGTVALYHNNVLMHTYTGVQPCMVPAARFSTDGKNATMKFYSSDFAFEPPAGFLPWSGPSAAARDPAYERITVLPAGSTLTLSNSNKTVSANAGASSYMGARSELFRGSVEAYTKQGKWYWELHLDDPTSLSNVRFGVAQAFNPDGTTTASNRCTIEILSQTSQTVFGGASSQINMNLNLGDTIGVAFAAANRVQFLVNGTVVHTWVNAQVYWLYPVVELKNGATVECVFHAEDFRQTIPAGYLPWAC